MTDHITLPRTVQALQMAVDRLKDILVDPDGQSFKEARKWLSHLETELRAALAAQQAEPVLVVEKEPDYTSRGHFYEGSKPWVRPTKVWKLPIGTKLYTAPQPAQPPSLGAAAKVLGDALAKQHGVYLTMDGARELARSILEAA